MTLPNSPRTQNYRMLMGAGATLAVLGVALSTGNTSPLGGFVTLAGVVLAVFAVHRFGRTGADSLGRHKRRNRAA